MGLTNWLAERQIRSFVRGICKTFVFGSNAHLDSSEKKGKSISSFADLAATTLNDRPGWRIMDSRHFQYKDGSILEIGDDYSVANIALLVCLQEYSAIMKVNPIPQEVIDIIKSEYMKIFKLSSDESFRAIIWKWEINMRMT